MTEAEASVATEEKEEVKAPEPKMDLMGAPRLVHRLLRARLTPLTPELVRPQRKSRR